MGCKELLFSLSLFNRECGDDWFGEIDFLLLLLLRLLRLVEFIVETFGITFAYLFFRGGSFCLGYRLFFLGFKKWSTRGEAWCETTLFVPITLSFRISRSSFIVYLSSFMFASRLLII